MRDVLIAKFFDPARWETAIEDAYLKGISQTTLKALCNPDVRVKIYEGIRDGKEIAPPHEAQIPKDDGTMRTVYVNEEIDRVLLSIANNLLMDECGSFIHPSCKSYQKGIGTGKVVKEVSVKITSHNGWKADLSKYFDSVPLEYIDDVFDRVELLTGESAVIDWLRKYYHSNYVIDLNHNIIEKYTSLKQGCAVASFLANVVLFHIDQKLSNLNGNYYRYSDDMIFIGQDSAKAKAILEDELALMGMKLNPKKVEAISGDKWFTFLGFSIKGTQISLSKKAVKSFQEAIESRTIKNPKSTYKSALNDVMRFMYGGWNGNGYSWATSKLPIINTSADVSILDNYVKDALRAVMTNRRRIGGIGYVRDRSDHVIDRGRGKNVASNRERTPRDLPGYHTIHTMANAIRTDRAVYNTIVRTMGM